MPYHISENVGGGAEVQAWLLAKELARRGNSVSYISKSVLGKAKQTESLDGVTIVWIKHTLRFPWLSSLDYYRALRAISPDIVIQRMTSFETGVAAHYCRLHHVPFVWICSDNANPFRWYFIKKQWGISKNLSQNWIKRSVLLANALLMDLSRHYGMAHTTIAFTQNEFQKKNLLRSFGLESSKMVSGHEMPISCLSPEIRLAGRICLWVSNLGENKRPQLFIDLAKRNQGNGWRFIMVGGKSDEALVQELFKNRPENLEWLGRLPFEETMSWFDRATWFVNTSKSEGFPNTFIQAWMRGVPVLSMEADPDGIISQNGIGMVCGDIDTMSKNIDIFSDRENYVEMSEKARDFANNNNSLVVMTDRFIETLSSKAIEKLEV